MGFLKNNFCVSHVIPGTWHELAVCSLSHAHDTKLIFCTGALEAGQAMCCCAHICCGAAAVGESLLAGKRAMGELWGACEMEKKIRSLWTGPKATRFLLPKPVLVVQCVNCEKSNIWEHTQDSVAQHPTGLSVLLRNPHSNLPASVRTGIFLDVRLLWTLRLEEMQIVTHP